MNKAALRMEMQAALRAASRYAAEIEQYGLYGDGSGSLSAENSRKKAESEQFWRREMERYQAAFKAYSKQESLEEAVL